MPRKTAGVGAEQVEIRRASMRPRPDAAENARDVHQRRAPAAASMRPRPDAAENFERVFA